MAMHTGITIFTNTKGRTRKNLTTSRLEHGKNRMFLFCIVFHPPFHCCAMCSLFYLEKISDTSIMSVVCSLDLHNETLRWENLDEAPKSICSEPCPAGHVHNHQDQCCWSCVKCREEFEFVKNDTCISCQPGWAPNKLKNGCDKLKAEVIDWLSPWAYVSNLVHFRFHIFHTKTCLAHNPVLYLK